VSSWCKYSTLQLAYIWTTCLAGGKFLPQHFTCGSKLGTTEAICLLIAKKWDPGMKDLSINSAGIIKVVLLAIHTKTSPPVEKTGLYGIKNIPIQDLLILAAVLPVLLPLKDYASLTS